MLTVACVLRQGGKVGYDATWVGKLHNSIARNLTISFEFVCLSDCPVPCRQISLVGSAAGYWAKLELFRPGLFTGPVLFFDLDTVLCQNIDSLVEKLLAQDNFVMWRDPDYNLSSSAIMYWNGDYSQVYQYYTADPLYYENRYSLSNQGVERLVGDQAVISTTIEHKFINDFCPTEWIHVVSKKDHALDLSAARILIFRKAHTKPSTMLDHKLVKEHWI